MQAAEIELKFPVANVKSFPTTAAELGFTLLTGRTFESNTLYDTPDRQLRARRQILRLRQYGQRWTVTHKRQDPAHADARRYKIRIETESEIEDGQALAEIFAQLGYAPVFRYEKFRTEWTSGDVHLVLDETPIGVWAELEGAPAKLDSKLDAMLERLGIAPEQCSTDSYGTLFLKWKTVTGSPAENLTFEEISAIPAL